MSSSGPLNPNSSARMHYDHRPIVPSGGSTSNQQQSIITGAYPSTSISTSGPGSHGNAGNNNTNQPGGPGQGHGGGDRGGGGGGSGISGGQGVGGNGSVRLNDLLDFVKGEFEQISSESNALRNQREEYELMINHHANELNAMRQISYDLERKHLDIKQSYEEEITRLRRNLDVLQSAPPPSANNHNGNSNAASLSTPQQSSSNTASSHSVPPSGSSYPATTFINSTTGVTPTSRRTSSPNPIAGTGSFSATSSHPGNGSTTGRLPSFLSTNAMGNSRPGSTHSVNGSSGERGSGPSERGTFTGSFPILGNTTGGDESKKGRASGITPYSPSQQGAYSLPTAAASRQNNPNPLQPGPIPPFERGTTPAKNGAAAGAATTSSGGSATKAGAFNAKKRERGPDDPVSVNTSPTSTFTPTFPPGAAPAAAGNVGVPTVASVVVASEAKKDPTDWTTIFNPHVKRTLDVGLVHSLAHGSVVCCVKFSPNGEILATGSNRNTTLYDTKTGALITTLTDGIPGDITDNYIRSASFSPDGKSLATGAEDKIVRVWNLATRSVDKVFKGHSSEIYSLAFSPDGTRLISGSGDRTAKMWNVHTGACVFTLSIPVTVAPVLPSMSINGDASVQPRRPTSDKANKPEEEDQLDSNLPAPAEPSDAVPTVIVEAGITSVIISPDGTLLAAASLDTQVRIFDALTGRLIDILKGHKDSVYSVAFSPDGKFLVSGSLDKTLKLWDIAKLRQVMESDGKGETMVRPKLEDGEDRMEVVEEAAADGGEKTPCLHTLIGHKDYVLSVAISPDGAWIISGSKDRGVQFWDPVSTKAQFMLQGHTNSVISVAVSDAGGLVATGSGDWSARIWSYSPCV